MKTYFIETEGGRLGPFTVRQLRHMWTVGSICGATSLIDTEGNVVVADSFAVEFENEPNAGGAMFVGFVGFLVGAALTVMGGIEFFAAKNAINEVAAAVMFVGGAILLTICIFGIALVSKR